MLNLISPSPRTTTTITSPEMQLLCYCALARPDKDIIEQIKSLLQQDINWTSLIQLSIAHAVMPLLYQNLKAICPESIPEYVLNQLKTSFHLNAIRNLNLTHELSRLLELLEANNIAAIPFKGPTLSILAYGNLSLRQFGDLDILVHKQNFLKARNLLLSDGYQRGTRPQGLTDTETQDLAIMHHSGEYPLCHPNGLVSIDLHGRLIAGTFPIMSANFDVFWENLAPISLLDIKVKTFQPENLLIYLCIHGSKDLWKRLNWICDIAELVCNYPQMDWTHLIKQAKNLGVEQMLLLGLYLARDILHISLPEVVAQHIQNHFKKMSLAIQIKQRILSDIHPLNIQYSWLQHFNFHVQLIEGMSDKVRYYFKAIRNWVLRLIRPNIKDQEFLLLPRKLYHLYYLIRPIRLSLKLYTQMWLK